MNNSLEIDDISNRYGRRARVQLALYLLPPVITSLLLRAHWVWYIWPLIFLPAGVAIALTCYANYRSLLKPKLLVTFFGVTLLTWGITSCLLAHEPREPIRSMLLSFAGKPEYEFKRDVSVIIVARDEGEFLGKSIGYLLRNTPDSVLRELVVVDDCSKTPVASYLTPAWFATELKKHKHKENKSRVIRFDQKQGLIRARVAGADLSTSPNIFFLDGHTRPEKLWWKPLLDMIDPAVAKPTNVTDPLIQMEVPLYKRVVIPQIFDIDRFTWEDKNTYGLKMMFDWTFEFDWFTDFTDEVPILPGGIQMITRRWWEESGKYDIGQREWGGENIEQSLRIWMCGGEIKQATESRVGHIFDRPPKPNPGNQLVRQVQTNQKRAAIVWLDDYYQYIERYHPDILSLDPGFGLEYRQLIRHRLQCKPFRWFVNKFKSVFQRRGLLIHEYHLIQDKESLLCLTARSDNHQLELQGCKRSDDAQKWSLVLGGRMLHNLGTKLCLSKNGHKMKVSTCEWTHMLRNQAKAQLWTYDDGQIMTNKHLNSSSSDGNDPVHYQYPTSCLSSNLTIASCEGTSPPWQLLW